MAGKGEEEKGKWEKKIWRIQRTIYYGCGLHVWDTGLFSTGGRLGQVSEINSFSYLSSFFCSKSPDVPAFRMIGVF